MKEFQKLTEYPSLYNHLEKKTAGEILTEINAEDHKVADAVHAAIPQITRLVEQLVPRMRKGGRLFYMGAGTSGRLGVLDASEIPPTYGMPQGRVIGLIAGGDTALRRSVESPPAIRPITRPYCRWRYGFASLGRVGRRYGTEWLGGIEGLPHNVSRYGRRYRRFWYDSLCDRHFASVQGRGNSYGIDRL